MDQMCIMGITEEPNMFTSTLSRVGCQSPLITPFLTTFLNHFKILPAMISPYGHCILACFLQICARHQVELTMGLFWYLFMFQVNQKGNARGIINIKAWDKTCCIKNLLGNNKGWKGRFFAVYLEDPLLINNIWREIVEDFKRPPLIGGKMKDVMRQIDTEGYDCNLYKSTEVYAEAALAPPVYPWKQLVYYKTSIGVAAMQEQLYADLAKILPDDFEGLRVKLAD